MKIDKIKTTTPFKNAIRKYKILRYKFNKRSIKLILCKCTQKLLKKIKDLNK